MTTVPTTPTTADKNREWKELSDKIAILKSAKEVAERALKQSVSAADVALGRLQELEKGIQELGGVIADVSRETSEFIASCEKIMRETAEGVKTALETVKRIEEAADAAEKRIADAKEDAKRINAQIVLEQAEISQKKADLEIYHGRLKKHFAEHMPGQVITI